MLSEPHRKLSVNITFVTAIGETQQNQLFWAAQQIAEKSNTTAVADLHQIIEYNVMRGTSPGRAILEVIGCDRMPQNVEDAVICAAIEEYVSQVMLVRKGNLKAFICFGFPDNLQRAKLTLERFERPSLMHLFQPRKVTHAVRSAGQDIREQAREELEREDGIRMAALAFQRMQSLPSRSYLPLPQSMLLDTQMDQLIRFAAIAPEAEKDVRTDWQKRWWIARKNEMAKSHAAVPDHAPAKMMIAKPADTVHDGYHLAFGST